MVCGADISKSKFNYCIIDNDLKKVKENQLKLTKNDLDEFVNIVKSFKDIVVIVESTGIYHINFVSYLLKNNINVKIINPKTIKRFIDYYFSNNSSKTDKKDAFAIAVFGVKNPEIINKANSSIPNTIKVIARELEYLSHQKSAIKTKIKSHLNILFPELEYNFDIFRKSILDILINFPSAKKIANANYEEIQSIIDNANHTGKKVKFNAYDIISLAKNSIASFNQGLEIALVNYINQLFIIENTIKTLEKELINESDKYFKTILTLSPLLKVSLKPPLLKLWLKLKILKNSKILKNLLNLPEPTL